MPIPSTTFHHQPPAHLAPSPIPASSITIVLNDPPESSIRTRYLRAYSRIVSLDASPLSPTPSGVRRARTLRRGPMGSHDTHPHHTHHYSHNSNNGSNPLLLHSPPLNRSERQFFSTSLPSSRHDASSTSSSHQPSPAHHRHFSPSSSYYARFHPAEPRSHSPPLSSGRSPHYRFHPQQPLPSRRTLSAQRSSSAERLPRSPAHPLSPEEGGASTFGGFMANRDDLMINPHHQSNGFEGDDSAMAVDNSTSTIFESPASIGDVSSEGFESFPSVTGIFSATNQDSNVPQTMINGPALPATSTALLPSSPPCPAIDDRLTLRHLRVSASATHPSLADTTPVACESEDSLMDQAATPVATSSATFAPARFEVSTPIEDSSQQHGEQGIPAYMDEEDEDEDDDGIDLVIQSRQNLIPETRSFVISTSTPPTLSTTTIVTSPQPVEHAQLSPRSAAALSNSMYNAERSSSSWGEPRHIPSAISDRLVALSHQQTHEYDSNPYFRQPSMSMFSTHSSNATVDATQVQAPEAEARVAGAGQPYRHSGAELLRDGPQTFHHHHPSGFASSSQLRFEQEHVQPREQPTPCGSEGFSKSLPFQVIYADGGDFSESHAVDNVLKNDGTVYCSRRSANINICLKLAEPAAQSFVLTGFKAQAPTSGFTAPCKEGLIFVSHEPIPLERASVFDNMTKERYDEYMRRMQQEGGINAMLQNHGANFVDSFLPAAFFQLDGPDESCSIEFNPSRSGRYVLIKLLRAKGVNSECPENIDVQYLGLYGYTGVQSFSSGQLL